jgi:hypothetical protein
VGRVFARTVENESAAKRNESRVMRALNPVGDIERAKVQLEGKEEKVPGYNLRLRS